MDAWHCANSIKKEIGGEEERFSHMVVSMHVYNMLSMSSEFASHFGNVEEIDGLTEVGEFFGFKVFLDMYMKPDEILLSCDKSSMRDRKLDLLLDGKEFHKEKRVKI
jgi:hypothetical protein